MVQRVVRGTVDDVFKRMAGNHIGIVNLRGKHQDRRQRCRNMVQHTNILQKLTNTKRARYNHRWRGNKNMKRWYGTDCKYPSTGWNAWDANGVGTDGKHVNRQETERIDSTYLAICGGAYGCICISWDDAGYDGPSIPDSR